MATLGPKTGDPAQLLTDLADQMTTNGGWTDGDTSVSNNQTDDDWKNNGRVLYHADSGLYVTISATRANSPATNNEGGFSFLISTEYDDSTHTPHGKTIATKNDVYDRGNIWEDGINDDERLSQTYNNHDTDGSNRSFKFTWTSDQNFPNGERSTWMARTDSSYHPTYTITTHANRVIVTAYNDDSNVGSAGYMAWEWLDNKLWNDGRVPFYLMTNCNASSDYTYHMNQFNWYYNNNSAEHEQPFNYIDYLSNYNESNYGFINADPNDDTYFFSYPLIDDEARPRRPVCHFKSVIRNQRDRGANHGDTVTEDGDTFRFFKKSGGSRNTQISCGYRWD